MDHDLITAIRTRNRTVPYPVGVEPNPFEDQFTEYKRRKDHAATRAMLTRKIVALLEPRFISSPETAECIESLITMTDSRQILELGTCTGFCSLHILRAIVGKENSRLVTVDARPEHDREFFSRPAIAPYFQHIEGWTPQCLTGLKGVFFDLIFVDSDHSVEHCEKETAALMEITKPGAIFLFHDVPQMQTPTNPAPPPVVNWLRDMVLMGKFNGLCLRSCEQLDGVDAWGKGYNLACSPGLGIFTRT